MNVESIPYAASAIRTGYPDSKEEKIALLNFSVLEKLLNHKTVDKELIFYFPLRTLNLSTA